MESGTSVRRYNTAGEPRKRAKLGAPKRGILRESQPSANPGLYVAIHRGESVTIREPNRKFVKCATSGGAAVDSKEPLRFVSCSNPIFESA